MDNLTKEQRRKNMTRIRSQNTKPERIIEQELKRRKIYFAKQVKTIIGKPDIVFRRKKVIVFIDSDFWHGHPKRYIKPKTNPEYWVPKIEKNVERDKKVNKELKKCGWKVIRLWEYDIKKDLNGCVRKILKAIDKPF
ncbi:MAG: very short patch repair endonuclease [Fibrobacter sp.]|nr:very short patch repair endonuclease [Fibrobacter sp.]